MAKAAPSEFNPNGAVIYRGPSQLDGAPIVVIVTGLDSATSNEKTGDMLQTWIVREDIAPHHAAKTGQDVSVCGDCRAKPTAENYCYVPVWQAPLSVHGTAARGRYREVLAVNQIAALGEGRAVRLGSYGDPAAVPLAVWKALTMFATGWTGYSHQWRNPIAEGLQAYCMASADTLADGITARAAGWRTFRVRTVSEAVLPRAEFICPASEEAGYKTDCATCRACMGTSAKAHASPVIIAHGAKAKRFALTRNGLAA
jgi:hypothetical protein